MGKKSILLISVGVLNFIHGLTHIIQFIQSVVLVSSSLHEHCDDDSWFNELMHNPIIAIIWALIGILTLIIGIKDY